jgi:hypothetical protein
MATKIGRTGTSSTNATKFTWSAWVKRTNVGSSGMVFYNYLDGNNRAYLQFYNDNLYYYDKDGGDVQAELTTAAKYRDSNAFYHICLIGDSTDGTQGDRIQLYVNGVRQTMTGTYPDASDSLGMKVHTGTNYHVLGTNSDSTSNPFSGIMSHVHYVDGIDYPATTFGSFDNVTGEWNINTSPSITTSNYGNNGYFVLKDGNSVTDQSGNSHNFTVTAGTLTKSEDNPSNIFATINTALGSDVIGSTVEFSAGNTLASDPNGQASGINPNFISTLGMPSKGKWYCEVQPASFSTSSGHSIGIYRTKGSTDDTGEGDLELNSSKIRYIYADTSIYIIKYGTNDQTGLTSISSGETVGMALDLDNGTLQYYVDGSARANQITGVNSANDGFDYFFHAGLESSSSGRYGIYKFNFGNGAFGSTQLTGTTYNDSQGRGIFKYQPPTNFLALCTKNLNV